MRFLLPISIFLFILFPVSLIAQDRDYLTDDEVEMVRNTQVIDGRVGVLVHAIDRRLSVLGLGGPVTEKQKDGWGVMPTGTRIQLLGDIKQILQKAIDDIDNLSERPDSAVEEDVNTGKKNKPVAEVLPKAVRTLASAAERYRPIFQAQLDTTKDNAEKGILMNSIDMCDEITAAVAKLPAPVAPTGKTKH
jgi:hypothetical protein